VNGDCREESAFALCVKLDKRADERCAKHSEEYGMVAAREFRNFLNGIMVSIRNSWIGISEVVGLKQITQPVENSQKISLLYKY
jgi:hypothetical protein